MHVGSRFVGARGAVGAAERRFEFGRVVEGVDWRWDGSLDIFWGVIVTGVVN